MISRNKSVIKKGNFNTTANSRKEEDKSSQIPKRKRSKSKKKNQVPPPEILSYDQSRLSAELVDSIHSKRNEK